MRNSSGNGCVSVFILVLFVGLILFGLFNSLGNQQNFSATIEKTYIDRGNTYFVLKMSDGSQIPFENEDNIFFGKMNSGDFLVKLEVGKTYQFKSVGYRIPFLSRYQNILSATLIQ